MKSLLWIAISIFIIIVAWPVFVFLFIVAMALILFSPKRVMVFRPGQRSTSDPSQTNPNSNVIDVEADVTIIEEEQNS